MDSDTLMGQPFDLIARAIGTGQAAHPGACRLNDTRSDKAGTYRRKVQFSDSLM